MNVMPGGQPAPLVVRNGPHRRAPPTAARARTRAASAALRARPHRGPGTGGGSGFFVVGAWITVPPAAAEVSVSEIDAACESAVAVGAASVVAYSRGCTGRPDIAVSSSGTSCDTKA